MVSSDGSLGSSRYEVTTNGVSPALNIDLSSILFTSVISGTAGETGANYKLTLFDNNMDVAVNGVVTRNGNTITIPYNITGTNSGNATQVSVLVLDKEYTVGNTNNASVIDYGKLAVDIFTPSGIGTYTLSEELSDKVLNTDYYLYIVTEDVNEVQETDYGSAPVNVGSIIDEINSVSIEIDAPAPETSLDTSVTLPNDIESATVTWLMGGNEVSGSALYNTTYTVKLTLTAADGYIFGDSVVADINGSAGAVTEKTAQTITISYTFPTTAKRMVSHSTMGYEGVYDGQPHSITVEVTEPADAEVTYSVDTGAEKTYTDMNPTFTNAGEYTVYYKIEKNNYETVTGSKTVKINKKSVMITAASQTITEGDNINATKYTVTGLVNGDNVNAVTLTPSTTGVTSNGSIIASIDKIINGLDVDVTNNYEISYTSGGLIINERITESESEETTTEGESEENEETTTVENESEENEETTTIENESEENEEATTVENDSEEGEETTTIENDSEEGEETTTIENDSEENEEATTVENDSEKTEETTTDKEKAFETTIKIQIDEILDWEEVYIYIWNPENENEEVVGAYPGVKMEKDGINYVYDIVGQKSEKLNIVISNNEGEKTGDIKYVDVSTGEVHIKVAADLSTVVEVVNPKTGDTVPFVPVVVSMLALGCCVMILNTKKAKKLP